MHYIAHRANVYGKDAENENKPYYIKQCIDAGYEAEIDLWFTDDGYVLGHDGPQYGCTEEFLKTPGLWVHCKNTEALQKCIDLGVHCFFHVTDNATLTSKGYIWAYPGKTLTSGSICVMPEWHEEEFGVPMAIPVCAGICSDSIYKYKNDNPPQLGELV